MDYVTTKSVMLLTILATLTPLVCCDCELNDLERHPCEADLSCTYDFERGLNLVSEWSCIQHDYNDYDHAYEVDEDYIIHLKADNIDETNLFDPLTLMVQLSDHIHTLSITNGKMNSIPAVILSLNKANMIDLSKNTIELINLGAFSKLSSLSVLNVSCNQIADLETYERTTAVGFSQTHTIDLSHNAIKALPDNYFRHFPNLLHLNLSHNFIKSFEILTFEGITQLQTLYISDNEITTLGVFFARFAYLKELFLDHNYLTTIEKNNFNTMTILEKLNLSGNVIVNFEDAAFDRLVALRELDLSNNKINTVTKALLQHNSNLQSLDISLNTISKIEPGAFEAKRITDFNIYDNPISGSLPKNTFHGIFIDRLDLSGANITELGADLFEGHFKYLNFSRNCISKIDKTTFKKLEFLTDLDISYNQLQNIEFNTSYLKNLTHFYINNNNIRKITKDMFMFLTTLKIVDLSYNLIEEVEMHSFEHLTKLKLLKLNNNRIFTIIPSEMCSGLVSTSELDISNTNINTIQNKAFNGMKSLKTFNSSYSNLTVLEANAFSGTGLIQILDLSYNQIERFSLNNTNIKLVEEIYLQYNKLQYVNDKTFLNLYDLRLLTLRGNNIVQIENESFKNLHNLLKIDLSANQAMVFNSSIFANMQSLSIVLLSNITSRFNLGNIVNTSVAGLDLSFCNITDINLVLVYPIITLERLKMSSNEILSIGKSSFQKLSQLSWVDISYNKISSIQPGSFNDNRDLNVLDLSNNLLSSLMFGVFEGLVNLNTIDLSSNMLHSFSASIFHNTPRVSVVFVENNLIDNFDFEEFARENIREIYLGGNHIPCNSLTNLKKIPLTFTVKARKGIYDTENVDGITCRSMTINTEVNKTHHNEMASTEISTGSLDEFQIAVENILNRSESYSVEKFLEVLNQSESKNNAMLEKLLSNNHQVTGGIYRMLEKIQEYLKVQNSISVDTHTPRSNDSGMNYNVIDKIESKKLIMYKKDESKVHSKADESSTLKYPLYFIATCLGVILCMVILSFVLVFVRLRNTSNLLYSNNLSHSRQPISNMMEME